MKSKIKFKTIVYLLLFIAFIILLKACVKILPPGPSSLTQIAKQREYSLDEKKISAFVWGMALIKNKLKCPSTAEFPIKNAIDFVEVKDDSFLITSYVDAQNSFGAKMRAKWVYGCVYKGGELKNPNSWIVLGCYLKDTY